jgi:unsaturated rhamnogalacturonyl hydrolase
LYGLLKLHEITGDADALQISLAWFRDRFEVGTTKASQTALAENSAN